MEFYLLISRYNFIVVRTDKIPNDECKKLGMYQGSTSTLTSTAIFQLYVLVNNNSLNPTFDLKTFPVNTATFDPYQSVITVSYLCLMGPGRNIIPLYFSLLASIILSIT